MLARNTRFFSSKYRKANSCVRPSGGTLSFLPELLKQDISLQVHYEYIPLISLSFAFFRFHLHRQPRNTGSDPFDGNSMKFMTLSFRPGSVCGAAQNRTSDPGIWPIWYQMCWNSCKCVNIKYKIYFHLVLSRIGSYQYMLWVFFISIER